MWNIYFCFAKIICMIVDEYKQRAVYKRYNLVGNIPDSVLKTSGAIFHVKYGCMYMYVDLDNICHIVAVFHVGLMQWQQVMPGC